MGLQYKTIDQLTKDLGLQANQLLPLFNKAIRKFTRLIKEVFEFEISQEMNKAEQQAMKVLGNVAANKSAASGLGNQTLNEELKEGAATGLGAQMATQMQADKEKFIAKHKIKKSQSEAIESVKLTAGSTVVSIPRKRSENDDEEGEDLAALEQKVRSKKGEKPFSNKRQRTK